VGGGGVVALKENYLSKNEGWKNIRHDWEALGKEKKSKEESIRKVEKYQVLV